MSKIFVFNYMDNWLEKSTKDILHETLYYIYPEYRDNNFLNVDYIGFSIKKDRNKNIGDLKEIWKNLTKVWWKNAKTLNDLLKDDNIDFNLVKAFNLYYEFYHKDEMSYNDFFFNEKRNYVKVSEIEEYNIENIETYRAINFEK